MSLSFTSTSYWGSCRVDPPSGSDAPSTWASAGPLSPSLGGVVVVALGAAVAEDGEAVAAGGEEIRSSRDPEGFGGSAMFGRFSWRR